MVGIAGFEPATSCPPDKCANPAALYPVDLGGVGEIRTHGTIARTTPFQGVTIGHSVTTPVFGATTYFLCRLLLSEGSSCMWPHKNGAAATVLSSLLRCTK